MGSEFPGFTSPQDCVQGDDHVKISLYGQGNITAVKDAIQLAHLLVGLFKSGEDFSVITEVCGDPES